MHQLHLVGFTADHDGLIFSTKRDATSGAYVVTIDDALFSALEEARRAATFEPDDASSQATADRVKALRATQRSSLSVRDIQSRLRAGVTLADIAKEAGVDEDWVARFAPPVLAEQAAVVERALPLTFSTNRKGPSSRALGDAVRWNLIDRRIDAESGPDAEGWSAFQLEPGQWAVRFSYASRGRQQVAEWEVDLETGELVARNRLASELGHVEAGARRRQVESVSPAQATAAPPARKAKAASPAKKAATGSPVKRSTAASSAKKATTASPAKKAMTGSPAKRADSGSPAKKVDSGSPAKKATGQGRPARTETARAQAADAASSKAAAARAKSGSRSAKGSSTSKRAGLVAPAAEPRRRSAPVAMSTPSKRSGGGASQVGTAAPPAEVQPPPGNVARFPAPRPAAARLAATGPAEPPSPARPASTGPARPAARRVEPPPASPQPPPARRRIGTEPSPRPVQSSPPNQRPARPAPAPGRRPASEPLVRRVAPPEQQSRRPRQVTADAKPMPAAMVRTPPAEDPPVTPSSTVRRIPSPSPVADAPAAEPASPVPQPEPAPPDPVPEPHAQPSPPPPAPANVRPVGGGDGRPTILIIDAERASDRRRS